MKALTCISLWQPWASAVADGHKRFETRHYSHRRLPGSPKAGDRIAVHAAKRVPTREFQRIWDDAPGTEGMCSALPRGAVVCVTTLVRSLPICVPGGHLPTFAYEYVLRRPDDTLAVVTLRTPRHQDGFDAGDVESEVDISDQFRWGDWTPGRYAWELVDTRKLPVPVPYVGQQGWFRIDLLDLDAATVTS
jgi:activating signal cointegrator 1